MSEIRTRSQGVKYALTPELRSHIQKMRTNCNLSTDELSKLLGMNKETYNNIERKKSSTTTITTDTLDKLFDIFYKKTTHTLPTSREQYIIDNLDKFLCNPDTNFDTLLQQDWLKAFYLKYQMVNLSENIIDSLFNDRNIEELGVLIKDLSKNRHIKLKTDITEENEVYINLKNKDKYPDYAAYPFWCIRYSAFSDNDVKEISNNLYSGRVKYSLLFALLINEELKSRRKKDYNDIFATVYHKLKMYGCINIFDRLETIIDSKKPTQQKLKSTYEEATDSLFVQMLRELDIEKYPDNVKHLVKHCINGGDNFLNAFDTDLTPLYTATAYDISIFKIRLREIIDNMFK